MVRPVFTKSHRHASSAGSCANASFVSAINVFLFRFLAAFLSTRFLRPDADGQRRHWCFDTMYTHWPLMLCNIRGARQLMKEAVEPHVGQQRLRPGNILSGTHAKTFGRSTKFNASVALICRSPLRLRCALIATASWKGLLGAIQGSPRRSTRPSVIARCSCSMYCVTFSMGAFGSESCRGVSWGAPGAATKLEFCRQSVSITESLVFMFCGGDCRIGFCRRGKPTSLPYRMCNYKSS